MLQGANTAFLLLRGSEEHTLGMRKTALPFFQRYPHRQILQASAGTYTCNGERIDGT